VDTPPPNLLETACARGGLCVRRPVRAAAVRAKPSSGWAKLIDEQSDNAQQMIFADPVFETLRKKCCLRPIPPRR